MTVPGADVGQVIVIGLVLTGAASPLVLKALRRSHVMDIPTDRSSHVVVTPRGGGLACLVGLLGAVALAPDLGAGQKLVLVLVGGAFAALGFADDVHHLEVLPRFAVQIVVAAVASGWAFGLGWSTSIGTVALAALGAIWIAAYVNAFNFMDGINGLAGAATAVAGLTFVLVGVNRDDAVLALGGAAAAGAALAFLPWNFPHAHFFLGDVGSYLFGGITGVLVAVGVHGHVPLEALIGPELIFLADTGWTLAGRIARGADWTSAHRTHVYQRLQCAGPSHTRTTVTLTVLMMATSALGLVSLTGSVWGRALADAEGVVLVVAYLASPGLIRRPVGALA